MSKTMQTIRRHVLLLLSLILLTPCAYAFDRLSLELELKRADDSIISSKQPPAQKLNFIKTVPTTYTPPPRYGEPVSRKELVLVALNDKGLELERTVIEDASLVEDKIIHKDGSVSASFVYVGSARFYASVPATTDRIRLYRPRFDAGTVELSLVSEAVIDAGTPMGTASRSMSIASTEPTYNTETVLNNGDPATRYDIVFVGDGFTAADLDAFRAAVETFKQYIPTVSPFDTYGHLLNIHRIDVISNDSGIDNLTVDPPVEKDTVFDSGNAGTQSMPYSYGKVRDVVMRHMPEHAYDAMAVISNGSGRANASSYYGTLITTVGGINNSGVTTTMVHELGHLLGLGDEYSAWCYDNEPARENLTLSADTTQIKWSHWIHPDTPLPTTSTDLDAMVAMGITDEQNKFTAPGFFSRDGDACEKTTYIPAFRSIMRSSLGGAGFGQVNEEILLRHLLQPLDMITDALPSVLPGAPLMLNRTANESAQLSIETSLPTEVNWYLDGQPIATGENLSLSAAELADNRPFIIDAIAQHTTEKVKIDKGKDLQDKQQWTVIADTCSAAPTIPQNLQTAPITFNGFNITWGAVTGASHYQVKLSDTLGTEQTFNTLANDLQVVDLVQDMEYQLSVHAINRCGESGPAVIVTTTQTCAPLTSGGAQNIRISDISNSSANVSWDRDFNTEQFEVYLGFQGENVHASQGVTTDSQFLLTGLTPDTDYSVQLRGSNSCGPKSFTPNKTFFTLPACSGTPNPVNNLRLSEVSNNAFTTTWDAHTPETQYQLYHYEDGVYQGRLDTPVNQYTFTNISSSSQHEVRVFAVNHCGISERRDITYTPGCSIPQNPGPVSFSNITSTSFTANWGAAEHADSYDLYTLSEGKEGYYESSELQYTATGFTPNSYVAFGVRARNEQCGISEGQTIGVVQLAACEGPPPPPASASITGLTDTGFSLEWDTVTGADSYSIRTLNEGTFRDLGPITDTHISLDGFVPGTYVGFEIKSNSGSCGTSETGYSNIVLLDPPPTGGSYEANNIASGWFSWKRYSVEIPHDMSTFTINLAGGSGNASLYVRKDTAPSTSRYDCRSANSGNNESCVIENPSPGVWHIGVYSGWGSISGAALDATWSP